ncbi:hypothetical protein FQZ97_1067070 [compost metagenome]
MSRVSLARCSACSSAAFSKKSFDSFWITFKLPTRAVSARASQLSRSCSNWRRCAWADLTSASARTLAAASVVRAAVARRSASFSRSRTSCSSRLRRVIESSSAAAAASVTRRYFFCSSMSLRCCSKASLRIFSRSL